MIYLLWSLLNIGLFLFFLVICFNATKLIREKFGLFASLVFVFGLLSFIGKSSHDDNKQANSNQIKTWELTPESSINQNRTHLLTHSLGKTMVSETLLGIKFGQDSLGRKNVPISAWSSRAGFNAGINWSPSVIVVERESDTKLAYSVIGIDKWDLLGVTIYSQPKEYKGIVVTK